MALAVEAFPKGHTVIEAAGRWMDASGRIITEQTLIVEWMVTDYEKASGEAHAKVNRFAARYKELASQKAVMVTTQEAYAVFV